jgi:hypothetical protein
MERKSSKLEQHQRPELEAQLHTHTAPAGTAFESVDELLRHDAAQTALPPQLEQRLAQSVENITPTRPAWWQRWLGKREP